MNTTNRLSVKVTDNKLDLERGIFDRSDPKLIAKSLKKSADRVYQNDESYQAALSSLEIYISRAGHLLPNYQLEALKQVKPELIRIFTQK